MTQLSVEITTKIQYRDILPCFLNPIECKILRETSLRCLLLWQKFSFGDEMPWNTIKADQASPSQETMLEGLLARLAGHLTSSTRAKLCNHFNFTDEEKDAVLSSQSSGRALILKLEQMGMISSSDTSKLETALKELHLVQAAAEVRHDHTRMEEESKPHENLSKEEKSELFATLVRGKTKHWFETLTPVPWRKSCEWKASDLFLPTGLVSTMSGLRDGFVDIDISYKLHYRDIFYEEKLEGRQRVIIEGEPGSGKTILSSQLAYDWSIGLLTDVHVMIYLPLKFLGDMTIAQAIRRFYIPENVPIQEDDIEIILNDKTKKPVLILDGIEESKNKIKRQNPSEVLNVIRGDKFADCLVIVTVRSEYKKGLPMYSMLRIGTFSPEEGNEYIRKVFPGDIKRQNAVREMIDKLPSLRKFCNVPLLYVLLVHNIDKLAGLQRDHPGRVTPFIEAVIDILNPPQRGPKQTGLSGFHQRLSEYFGSRPASSSKISLEELAFDGLCRGKQQVMWEKDFVNSSVLNSESLLDTGILVVEEGPAAYPVSGDAQTGSTGDKSQKIEVAEMSKTSATFEKSSDGANVSSDQLQGMQDGQTNFSQTGTPAKPVRLLVKFLHKLIQEYYAARHLADMFRNSTSTDDQPCKEHLLNIDPYDLQYLFRFTCNIYPPSFPHIARHLMKCDRTVERNFPDYVLDRIYLCFAEYDGDVSPEMRDTLAEFCQMEPVTIRFGDSWILTWAKVSLLGMASKAKIPIKHLKLTNVVESVSGSAVILRTGVCLEAVDTVKTITISRRDILLRDEDYQGLVKFVACNKGVTEARFDFPTFPPGTVTDQKVLSDLNSRNVSVTWHVGINLYYTLNTESGDWQQHFRYDTWSSTEKKLQDPLYCVKQKVGREGGQVRVAETDVVLEIPPEALEDECSMEIRIIPSNCQDLHKFSFVSNTSVVVEVLPRHLEPLKPVKLTLPHCLQFKNGCQRKAKIFSSHHKKGERPRWTLQPDAKYTLTDRNCEIWLTKLGWQRFEVSNDIVEGKRLMLYVSLNMHSCETLVHLDVGYHSDIPRSEELIKMNNVITMCKDTIIFKKEGSVHLKAHYQGTNPPGWLYSRKDDNPKTIHYRNVVVNEIGFCTFPLRRDPSVPVPGNEFTCDFEVWQGSTTVKLPLVLKLTNSKLDKRGSAARSHARCEDMKRLAKEKETKQRGAEDTQMTSNSLCKRHLSRSQESTEKSFKKLKTGEEEN